MKECEFPECDCPANGFDKLCKQEEASSGNSDLLIAAMKLYEPPFTFMHGYIFDNANNTVADDGDVGQMEKAVISRVRGWGRLQYLKDEGFTPAQLQDAIGEIVVTALNEYWERHEGV